MGIGDVDRFAGLRNVPGQPFADREANLDDLGSPQRLRPDFGLQLVDKVQCSAVGRDRFDRSFEYNVEQSIEVEGGVDGLCCVDQQIQFFNLHPGRFEGPFQFCNDNLVCCAEPFADCLQQVQRYNMIRLNQVVEIVAGNAGNNGVFKCSGSRRPLLVLYQFHLAEKISFSKDGERSLHTGFRDLGNFHFSFENQIEPFAAGLFVEDDRSGAERFFLQGFGDFQEIVIADILEEGIRAKVFDGRVRVFHNRVGEFRRERVRQEKFYICGNLHIMA